MKINLQVHDEEGEYTNYEDALSEDPAVAKDVRTSQRRKLWVISFTSEVRQTLADDEATVSLPPIVAEVDDSDSDSEKLRLAKEPISKDEAKVQPPSEFQTVN